MVEANGAYTPADIEIFRELDEFDLLMFEQPMAADDLDGLAELQEVLATPVCLDESAETLEPGGRGDLDRGSAGSSTSRSSASGGSGRRWRSTTSAPEGGLLLGRHHARAGGRPGAGHPPGTLANCKYPTDVEPSARWFVDDYVVPLIELSAPGVLSVPNRPGLGYQIDAAKLRRYQVRHRNSLATMSNEQ